MLLRKPLVIASRNLTPARIRMRLDRRWLALVLFATGCDPSPDKVCAHLRALDDAAPLGERVDGSRVPRPGRQADEVEACVRRLNELQRVDRAEYQSCAKCVMKAERWADGWDCWVLDHLSKKETAKIDALVACDSACEADKKGCDDRCDPTGDACRDSCMAGYEKCITKCQFD